MTLLDANQVPIKKLFIFPGAPYYYFSRYDQRSDKQKVGVFLEIENTKKNNLGMPLPKGTVGFTKRTRTEASSLSERIGSTIPPKMKNSRSRSERPSTSSEKGFRQITNGWADNLFEVAFEVSLRNHKKEDIKVLVEEPIPGDWEMLSNTHPFEKVSAHLIRFDVPVAKDKEVKVKYRIRFKY